MFPVLDVFEDLASDLAKMFAAVEDLFSWPPSLNSTSPPDVSAPPPSGSGGHNASFMNDVLGFFHAISWDVDLWIYGLISFHILGFWVAWKCRKESSLLIPIAAVGAILCGLSEVLNDLASRNFHLFSSQNYFDPHGSFCMIFWALPLLFLEIFVVGLLLSLTVQALIEAKRLELRQKLSQTRTQKATDTSEEQGLRRREGAAEKATETD